METVEVIVYMVVALAIGVLMLQFLTSWDYRRPLEGIKQIFSKEKKVEFKTVDSDEFVAELYNLWQTCGFGEVDKQQTLYVNDKGGLNKSMLFAKIRKLNLCNSLQSAMYSCGSLEQVKNFPNITLPHIIRVECNSTAQKITIRGD
jgi:hypothetical protein